MSLSTGVRLAQAKRVLRRMKETEPGFLRAAAGAPAEQQAFAERYFQQALESQLAYIRELERSRSSGG
jgi:hypothetical protein